MFYDRQEELRLLRQKLERLERGELLIIYGRRRVGKTELVKHFLQGAKGIYLYVDYCEPYELLNLMSKDAREQTGEFVAFRDWDMLFDWLSNKRVAVLDEFQRLHSISPAAITRLQRWWDERMKSKPIMLILVGSSIGMLRKVATGGTAPLYGRATSHLKLEPFTYKDVRGMFKELPEEKRLEIYGIFGGTPHYLQFVNTKAPILENVRRSILEKGSPLFEEPPTLLRTELKEVTRYNSIMTAIAKGKGTVKEISDFTGIGVNKVMYYIENLKDLLDLVEMRRPVMGKERMGRYRIRDNFFKFWYTYVFTNRSSLERGEIDPVLAEVKGELNAYLGPVFEDVVRELLIEYNHKNLDGFGIAFDEIGCWWDRAGNEIDICARGKGELLLGEVKWGMERAGPEIVSSLIRKSELIGWKGKKKFLVASAGGFTGACKRAAEEENVLCLDLARIERMFDKLEGGRS